MSVGSQFAAGTGVCSPVSLVRIRPYREVLDLGVGPDILRAVFAAVHRANRHSTPENYAAITLPGAAAGRGLHGLGDGYAIFGTEEILDAVLEDVDLAKMRRRDMFAARIRDVDHEIGEMGTYLVRDRSREKGSDAATARQARRDARRVSHIAATCGRHAEPLKPRSRPAGGAGGFVTLQADRKISFLAGQAVWEGRPVRVNTYGLSIATEPSILPGAPDERS